MECCGGDGPLSDAELGVELCDGCGGVEFDEGLHFAFGTAGCGDLERAGCAIVESGVVGGEEGVGDGGEIDGEGGCRGGALESGGERDEGDECQNEETFHAIFSF